MDAELEATLTCTPLTKPLRALRNNWIASVSTLTTMTLSLTILAGFSLLSLNLNLTLQELQSDLELAAYLEEGANPSAITERVQYVARGRHGRPHLAGEGVGVARE